MATFTDVFERKEVKYRLDASQHRAMIDALAGRMAPDAFGRTRIVSRYLDTPERMLIERSLDKPLYKEKLRLRGYGSPAGDDRVFVEIKKKFKGIVYKRRVGCSLAAARAYLCGMPYEQACARYPLPDAQMAAESLSARSVQIAREIDSFVALHGPLRPSMLIICERTAYASLAVLEAAGESEGAPLDASNKACIGAAAPADDVPDDLRITFDEGIAYCDLLAAAPTNPQALLPKGHVVMEIKSAGPYPLWLVRALDACEARPSSFSKYGAAYRACIEAAEPVAVGVAKPVRVPASTGRAASLPAAASVRRQPARASHAAAEQKAERLASALRDARPRRFRAPNHSMKKGGRCA